METAVESVRATDLSGLSREARNIYISHAHMAKHEDQPEDWRCVERVNPKSLEHVFELEAAGLLVGVCLAFRLNGPLIEPTYQEYIESDLWRDTSEFAKLRAGNKCQVCNVHRDHAILDTHHRTYERLGTEEHGDLTVLCRECHTLFHEHRRVVRPGE